MKRKDESLLYSIVYLGCYLLGKSTRPVSALRNFMNICRYAEEPKKYRKSGSKSITPD